MKNVTISLDEETAHWARVQAAHQGISISRLVGEILRERRLQEADYQAAMGRFLNRPAHQLKQPGERYPDREKLYDRPILC
jgi:hypothetical protein